LLDLLLIMDLGVGGRGRGKKRSEILFYFFGTIQYKIDINLFAKPTTTTKKHTRTHTRKEKKKTSKGREEETVSAILAAGHRHCFQWKEGGREGGRGWIWSFKFIWMHMWPLCE